MIKQDCDICEGYCRCKPYDDTPTLGKTFKKESKDSKFTKPMFELIVPEFLHDVAVVLTEGAKKYGVDNYKNAKPEDIHHYLGALHRHLNEYQQGYKEDEESKLSHLTHIAVNAMFLYYYDYLQGVKK